MKSSTAGEIFWHEGMLCCIHLNTVPGFGKYYCGYVAVTNSNKLFECPYSKSRREVGGSPEGLLECHGGITYSGNATFFPTYPGGKERWWFGFDCAHYGDTIENCSLEYVKAECIYLAKQLKVFENTNE